MTINFFILDFEGVKTDMMSRIDNTMSDKEWFMVYWNYFALMSKQRIEMLNFYISIEIVLFGGMFALLQLKARMHWAEYLVAFAIFFMSVIFGGIDYRTKIMIHKCEELMTHMEDKYKPFRFGADPIHYINKKTDGIINISYSKWFILQFIIIGLTGFVLALMIFCGHI